METNNALLKAAVDYQIAGLSPMPCNKLDKHPTIDWKKYQDTPPSADQVKTWFQNPACDAIGILMGNGKETIDFDANGKEFEPWKSMVISEKPGLFEMFVIEKTQNDGFHVTYMCDEIRKVRSDKLAAEAHPVDKAGIHTFYGKPIKSRQYDWKHYCIVTTIETRAQGGLIICAPTPGYELIQGNFTNIPTITEVDRDFLIETARSFNQWVEPAKVINANPPMPRAGSGLSPAEEFNQRGDIKPILAKHGAVELQNGHWRRPGKEKGQSASLLDDKVFYVFSSNWHPFEPCTGYSKFAVYAYLEHNGDFSQAAYALIKQGYGNKFTKQTRRGENSLWDAASERFPRQSFPWDVFPSPIAESLKQVARSCATSDVAMPGAAMTAMASVLGRTLSTSGKASWVEPSTLWVADIRISGDGKTPPARMLLEPIYRAQQKTDEMYHAELDRWESKPKKDRGVQPKRPAGHFVTNFTLEGVHTDVQQGHGGMLCVVDELSAMFSSQNQYKQKGCDREAWIALWDGHEARISRASQSTTIRGARISVFGGIQPEIFRMAFRGDKGVYLHDGTMFRFLFTYDTSSFIPLTDECWSDENRKLWESTLTSAMNWAENISSIEGWKSHVLKLSNDAWKFFQSYRNSVVKLKHLLPEPMQGFIPKAISEILRIAGILDCFLHFSNGTQPGRILGLEDIKKTISVIEYYLGHTVCAMRLLESDANTVGIDAPPVEMTEMTSTLAKTIELLRGDLDSGRLAVGYIFDKFNEKCAPTLKVKSAKAMGALLRGHGLTTPPGQFNANGRRGVYCLAWDEKTEQLVQTLRISTKQNPQEETLANTEIADIADIADIDQKEEYDIEGAL